MAGPSVLAALVAPHSVEEFMTRYWPDRVFAVHGDPARLPSFLPRGTWHHTECGADSLSVSVSLFMSSAADWVLRELRLLMLQDSQWRRPLYGAWGGDSGRQAAEAQLAQLLAALPELARQLSPEGVTRNLLPLEQRLKSIGPRDRFQRTPHTRLEVEESPSPIVDAHPWISFKVWDSNYGEGTGARVQVSRAAVPVFRWIAEQPKPFTAADLAARFPDLQFSAHQQILQVATGAGFVKLLWFAALTSDAAPDDTRPA